MARCYCLLMLMLLLLLPDHDHDHDNMKNDHQLLNDTHLVVGRRRSLTRRRPMEDIFLLDREEELPVRIPLGRRKSLTGRRRMNWYGVVHLPGRRKSLTGRRRMEYTNSIPFLGRKSLTGSRRMNRYYGIVHALGRRKSLTGRRRMEYTNSMLLLGGNCKSHFIIILILHGRDRRTPFLIRILRYFFLVPRSTIVIQQ